MIEQKLNKIADTMTRAIMGDTKQSLKELKQLLPVMSFAHISNEQYNVAFKEVFNAIHEQLHNLKDITTK